MQSFSYLFIYCILLLLFIPLRDSDLWVSSTPELFLNYPQIVAGTGENSGPLYAFFREHIQKSGF